MRTRALHTEARFCAKAVALHADCIGCPVTPPRIHRDRFQFDEKLNDTRPIRRVTQFCLAVRLCPFHDNLPCDAQHNGSTMKLEPLRTEYYKRRTAAPASKSNFRKFRRKHDGRQTWAREDDSIRNSYARRDSVAVNVLSAGQCGG